MKYHWPKSGKGEKTVNLSFFDEERLDPHGVGNLRYLPHVLRTKKKISHPHLESNEELSARITDVLTKFQSSSG